MATGFERIEKSYEFCLPNESFEAFLFLTSPDERLSCCTSFDENTTQIILFTELGTDHKKLVQIGHLLVQTYRWKYGGC